MEKLLLLLSFAITITVIECVKMPEEWIQYLENLVKVQDLELARYVHLRKI